MAGLLVERRIRSRVDGEDVDQKLLVVLCDRPHTPRAKEFGLEGLVVVAQKVLGGRQHCLLHQPAQPLAHTLRQAAAAAVAVGIVAVLWAALATPSTRAVGIAAPPLAALATPSTRVAGPCQPDEGVDELVHHHHLRGSGG